MTAKFFDPTGSFTWFLTELDEDLDYAFGFVVSEFCPNGELGPFSINELQSIKGHLGLGIERDKFWTVATLKEVMDNPSNITAIDWINYETKRINSRVRTF